MFYSFSLYDKIKETISTLIWQKPLEFTDFSLAAWKRILKPFANAATGFSKADCEIIFLTLLQAALESLFEFPTRLQKTLYGRFSSCLREKSANSITSRQMRAKIVYLIFAYKIDLHKLFKP